MDSQPRTPSIGRIVIHRTQDPNKKFNGSKDHPAIVTCVFAPNCINVMVLPDCGTPYCATSQGEIDPASETAQGWFWPSRAG